MTPDERLRMITNRLDMIEALVLADRALTIASIQVLDEEFSGYRNKVAEKAQHALAAELPGDRTAAAGMLGRMIAELDQPNPAND